MLRAADTLGAALPSPAERRESLRALTDLAGDPPAVDTDDLACPARDGARLALRRYDAPGAAPQARPAILYLHGGGWVAGDLDTHAGVCGALALASGCRVFALHYRRPPEHPFPGPIHDAQDALNWIDAKADALGVDRNRLVLAGDSAGANLATAALLDGAASLVALQVLICPILDLPRRSGSRARYGQGFFLSADRLEADARDYLQGQAADSPLASPLRADGLAGLPPALIHAAACDPFRDEAAEYAERLQAAGVSARFTEHVGMIHYFYALPRAIPYARQAMAQIGAEVAAALGG